MCNSALYFFWNMHIGKMIREVLRERQMTVVSFAERLSCTRENAHRILNKVNMDTGCYGSICIKNGSTCDIMS